MKITYKGHMKRCRIRIGASTLFFARNETKEVSDSVARELLKNADYISEDGQRVEEIKEEKETIEEEPVFDYEKASKDALLDFTAEKGIEADYSETKTELKEKIKEYLG